MPVGSRIRDWFCPLQYLVTEESPGVADPVMLEARSWACETQGYESLPKDIRWLLVMIFEVSCRALRLG